MKEYSIDVGTWERGRTHKLYAETPQEAYRLANKLYCSPTKDEEVVQIHEIVDERECCVYDQWNGFELYQGGSDEGIL